MLGHLLSRYLCVRLRGPARSRATAGTLASPLAIALVAALLTAASAYIAHAQPLPSEFFDDFGDAFFGEDFRLGDAVVTGDFNGDGYLDAAAGAPGVLSSVGAAVVVYGAESGFQRDSDGVLFFDGIGKSTWEGTATIEAGDRFGVALAAADFNRDGIDDLAIGIPGSRAGGDNTGTANAGAVLILYGMEVGFIGNVGGQLWHQDVPDMAGLAESGDAFGTSLAVGDFDGDTFPDLAVGVPSEDASGNGQAGAVNIIYGTAVGLGAVGSQTWFQESPGILGDDDGGDMFGQTLAAGNFDNDDYDDLAIGVPGELASRGKVQVLYGSETGIDDADNQAWDQDSTDIGGVREAGDGFGLALAVGDFDRDSFDDLAVGVPNEDIGAIADAGTVNVIYGAAAGLSADGNQLLAQGQGGLAGSSEANEAMGAALAVGDFDGDATDDLMIGIPGQGLGADAAVGEAMILHGAASSGLDTTSVRFLSLLNSGIAGDPEADSRYGSAAAAGDFNDDGRADLLVGVPDYPNNDFAPTDDVGALSVVFAGEGDAGLCVNGLLEGCAIAAAAALPSQLWTQNSPGMIGRSEEADRLGEAVATGDFNGDGFPDLAIGAPEEDGGGPVEDAGVVNVIFGGPTGLGAFFMELTRSSPAALGEDEEFDYFGTALVSADFDGDTFDDLAVGTPDDEVDGAFSGSVSVFYGHATTPFENRQLLGTAAQLGSTVADGLFGKALAVGHFDLTAAGEYADLAVGEPGNPNGGQVYIFYGGMFGLQFTGAVFNQGSPSIPGAAEAGDGFGNALASGDFDRDGFDEVVVGVPAEDIGSIVHAGAVVVIPGAPGGIDGVGSTSWTQDDFPAGDVVSASQEGDRFGDALATGDFDRDGYEDLAIGMFGQAVNGNDRAGAVQTLYGSRAGLQTVAEGGLWYMTTAGGSNVSEADDWFGRSLAAADFDFDGFCDLAIGVPGRDGAGGAVKILYGSANKLTADGSQDLDLSNSGIPGESSGRTAQFGLSLATADFNADRRSDLVVGSPVYDVGTQAGAGAASVVYAAEALCVSDAAPDCPSPPITTTTTTSTTSTTTSITSTTTSTSSTTSTTLPPLRCSKPVDTSNELPLASDCLFILRAAVELDECTPSCICRPTGGEIVRASDALLCLRAAVSAPVTLACPCV